MTDEDLARVFGESLARAYLDNQTTSETEDYLARGRSLGALSDAQLATHWVNAFKAMVASSSNEPAFRRVADAHAELGLRNQVAPYERVIEQMLVLFEIALKATERSEGWDLPIEDLKEFAAELRSKLKS
jgi:hypothetical protein